MLETGTRVTARGALVIALIVPLSLAAGARAEEGGAAPPSSTLAAFEELFSRTTAEVGGGAAGVAAAAEEIRFGLKTALIRSDAEIEVLKLEAARFSGARQQQALDELVRAAAARERHLWQAIRRLEGLSGNVAEDPPETTKQDEQAGHEPAGERGSIQFSFEPQDVAADPDP